jgi:predicted ATPase/class 3 adenylate cyclase
MAVLGVGVETVVLVLTDVQGSTKLWQDQPVAMDAAMARHHVILHGAIGEHGGWRPVDQGEGDAVFAAFRSATAAVAAVVRVQRELAAESWPTSVALTVRIGVHLGEVTLRNGNLYGDPVNRCARLRGLGAGGQSLLSAAVYEMVRDKLPPGVTVTDLGDHRMKDLVRPEHVWQLDIEGLPNAFGPLASLDRVTHNLPVQAAPFIGRETELRDLVATVREHRLVTLTGFGGMGKTRLALQAAAELAGEHDVGDVWFVDLAAQSDPTLVPTRVAEAAGVGFGTGEPLAALVAAFAGRPTLLVLDNLEQLIGCATFVADLVASAPAVRVLCTSREPLRVRSEQQVLLASMAVPEKVPVTAEVLSTYEAVRFFVDRACAVRADFTITNETAPAVAAICARLDGHPLALELAAARVKMLSVDKLLVRLDSALGVLTGGSRDMPERHQTLRATIAWSYDALEAPEQLLLARMSVLTGPADLELLEAVCGQDLEVFDVLEVLVQRSLVRTVDLEADTRFGLLVSVRDFAAEHLNSHDALVLRDRLAGHLLAKVTAIISPHGQGQTAAFTQDAPHLRAALIHLQQTGQTERVVALVVALEDGVAQSGHLAEALEMTELALSLTEVPSQRARLFRARVSTFSGLGALDGMREAGLEGLAAARDGDDTLLHAQMVLAAMYGARDLSELHSLQAEYDALRTNLSPTQAPALDEEAGYVLSQQYRNVDPDRAEEQARRHALATKGSVPHRPLLARILMDLGRADEALEVLGPTQAPDAFEGVRPAELYCLGDLARCHLMRGETDRARELATASLEELIALGAVPNTAASLLARLEVRAGNLEAALAVLDRVIDLTSGQHGYLPASMQWRRALVHHALDDAARANADLEAARPVLAALPLMLLELLGCLGTEALVTTDPARAALLLGNIEANRKSWVLPQDLDGALAPLLAQLSISHPETLLAGGSLAPHVAAGSIP